MDIVIAVLLVPFFINQLDTLAGKIINLRRAFRSR